MIVDGAGSGSIGVFVTWAVTVEVELTAVDNCGTLILRKKFDNLEELGISLFAAGELYSLGLGGKGF